ncbi:MAG: hypothetical protein JO105_18445 [Hyphomicrobiales bacterium]|nr:hypothetical protein [Hyphomicrobiales bacterium]
MEGQFRVVEVAANAITIEHCDEKHTFRFNVVLDAAGQRILSKSPLFFRNDRAKHSADFWRADALDFAERQARSKGIIP